MAVEASRVRTVTLKLASRRPVRTEGPRLPEAWGCQLDDLRNAGRVTYTDEGNVLDGGHLAEVFELEPKIMK